MECETRELWMILCEQAAVERDPLRLLELMEHINELLEQKEMRLRERRVNQSAAGHEC